MTKAIAEVMMMDMVQMSQRETIKNLAIVIKKISLKTMRTQKMVINLTRVVVTRLKKRVSLQAISQKL